GVYVKVFPCTASINDLLSFEPDGIFVSNGPGDPAAMDYAVKTVRDILDSGKPMFGICLGHQLLARANGISTYKMHHGHRGLNRHVNNRRTGLCVDSTQNHGLCVDEDSVRGSADKVEVTHINLNDDTVEGIKVVGNPAFSVQYHPERPPGSHDSRYFFDDF